MRFRGYPKEILTVRHAQSEGNARRKTLTELPEYKEFEALFLKENKTSTESVKTKNLAKPLVGAYKDNPSDHCVPLTQEGRRQAQGVAHAITRHYSKQFRVPDVIFCSPYKRTVETLEIIQNSSIDIGLNDVDVIMDDRLREQEVGIISEYGDYFLFFALNPEQEAMFKRQGLYYYRFPNGESVTDVRMRLKSWLRDVQDQYRGKRIMVVSHFNTLLTMHCEIEEQLLGQGLGAEYWVEMEEKIEKINCAVSQYVREYGKLVPQRFNQKLWR